MSHLKGVYTPLGPSYKLMFISILVVFYILQTLRLASFYCHTCHALEYSSLTHVCDHLRTRVRVRLQVKLEVELL